MDSASTNTVDAAPVNSHSCDFGIPDSADIHNFAHYLVDQISKSRPLLELYKSYSLEQKQELRDGLAAAENKYNAIRNTHLDFICFFDNQAKQPVDVYDSAHSSLQMSNARLANISLARTMLDRWDSGAVYLWSDADNVIARTRFLKTGKKG